MMRWAPEKMIKTNEKDAKSDATPASANESTIETKKNEVEELTNTLKRLQADFENYKKQVDKEKERSNVRVKIDFVKQLLPVVDAFQIALKNRGNAEQFAKGMEMVYSQLHNSLHAMGVHEIEAVGRKFDPHVHEVLLKECKEGFEEDTITEELQRGYVMHGAVVRTSKVKVAKIIEKQDGPKDGDKKTNPN